MAAKERIFIMPVIEIKNEKLTVGIDTFGAELKYVNGYVGTKFMWPGEVGVWKSTAPILFPFCGFFKDDTYEFRGKEYHLKGNGFANIKEFEVNLISDTKAEFSLLPDEETLNGYPFDFAFKVVFELVGNRLKTDYVITNNGDDIMPFGVGGHEGYYCPEGIEEYEVHFEKSVEGLVKDNVVLSGGGKVVPLKYEYFTGSLLFFENPEFSSATLVHTKSNKKVHVDFKGSNHFLVWSKPGAKFLCLEPWYSYQISTYPNRDLEKVSGIVILPAGETFVAPHWAEFSE